MRKARARRWRSDRERASVVVVKLTLDVFDEALGKTSDAVIAIQAMADDVDPMMTADRGLLYEDFARVFAHPERGVVRVYRRLALPHSTPVGWGGWEIQGVRHRAASAAKRIKGSRWDPRAIIASALARKNRGIRVIALSLRDTGKLGMAAETWNDWVQEHLGTGGEK